MIRSCLTPSASPNNTVRQKMKIPKLGLELDVFGDTDPKKMPAHLWSGLRTMDYSSAVRADTTKQDFTVCPRHWYIDAVFQCVDCGKEFLFSAKEQRFWYEERGFYVDSLPKRCAECRKKERTRKSEAQLPKTKRK